MREMELDALLWMLGVIAVMVIYGLFAAYGIHQSKK